MPQDPNLTRILLIENDRDTAASLEGALGGIERRHEVVRCERLCEAIEQLEAEHFQVVLVDLHLPDTDGLRAIRYLQKADCDVPVIVFGDVVSTETALLSVRNGAQDCLSREQLDTAGLDHAIRLAIARKGGESTVHEVAHRDTLTGLPNRLLLTDRLNQAIAGAVRSNERIAVMQLDLDGFTEINQRCGHSRGDEVLQAAAKRLLWSLRATDTVARVGGDEFVLVLPGLKVQNDAAIAAEHVLGAFDEALRIGNEYVEVKPSIGIALWPNDGKDVDQLLKNADAAMYVSKNLGGATYQFHSAAVSVAAERRRHMADAMRKALRNNEFRLHYQPIVESESGYVSAVEALLRWQSPEEGLLHPSQFLQVAERTRMIVPIGEWVIREACRQNRMWRGSGYPAIAIAVNVSPYQLMTPRFVHVLLATIEENGLLPCDLRVEVTESAVGVNRDRVMAVLSELEAAGVPVSLDDFGTGAVPLGHLRDFPADTIKVDPTFVQALGTGSRSDQRVRGLIDLAHGMGKKVVAEGVETAGQFDTLSGFACDEIQGFLVSEPVPGRRLPELLRCPLTPGPVAA